MVQTVSIALTVDDSRFVPSLKYYKEVYSNHINVLALNYVLDHDVYILNKKLCIIVCIYLSNCLEMTLKK